MADYLISASVPRGHDHMLALGCATLFFAAVCISTMYCCEVLDDLFPELLLFIEDDALTLRSWYSRRLKTGYEGIWPALAGIAFVLLSDFTIGDQVRAITPDHVLLQYFRNGYRWAGFFFLGVSLFALVNVLFIPMQLVRFKVRVSLNQLSGRGLQALGSSFFKMSIAITLCFLLIVLTSIFANLSNNRIILVWEALGACLIFSFFLLPQIGVHRIMAGEKEQRIFSFSHHLEAALQKSVQDPSSENMQRLKELFELQQHLRNLNEWPFNMNTVWQLVTALLIPLLLASLEIIF